VSGFGDPIQELKKILETAPRRSCLQKGRYLEGSGFGESKKHLRISACPGGRSHPQIFWRENSGIGLNRKLNKRSKKKGGLERLKVWGKSTYSTTDEKTYS